MLQTSTEIYAFNGFHLNVGERLLLYHDQPVRIPEKAFGTLRVLVQNAGHLVTKDKLLSDVWGGSFVEENNLDKSVSTLRQTLGSREAGTKFIETVRGHGYRFVVDVEEVGSAASGIGGPLIGSQPIQMGKRVSAHVIQSGRQGNIVSLAQWRLEPHDRDDFKEDIPVQQADRRREWLRSWRFAVGSAAVAFAVLIGLSFYFLSGRSPVGRGSDGGPFTSFTIKRFSDNGSFNPAVISPDGKFIAYTDKDFGIWLKNAETDTSIEISPLGIERAVIGFSPDHGFLYIVGHSKDRRSELLKMAVFGHTPPQKIAENLWNYPAISPDGQQIAFTRYDPETGVFSIIGAATDGSGERTIATSKENERFDNWKQSIAWSPDAGKIACIGRATADESVARFIQILRIADGEEIGRIIPPSEIDYLQAVAWLPDGDNLIVIGHNQASLGQIYRSTISTNTWQRITNDLIDYNNLSITADGKTIITTAWNNHSNLWTFPADRPDEARQITFGFNKNAENTGISWTADGQIVYVSNVSGRWEIWMVDADGSNQKQLSQNCAGNDACSKPFVSPDNRYIVFHASRNGRHNIWRMDIDGANPVQLTTDGGIAPFVTPDSRSIIYGQAIYANRKGTDSTLWQIPIDGGKPQRLNGLSSTSRGFLSPDGTRLLFDYYNPKLKQPWQGCVADVRADKPERCFESCWSAPQWTLDGKGFYCLGDKYESIWKQSLAGDRERLLEFPGERINDFAFSADHKTLVVARSKPTQDIVAIIDEK